MKQIITIQHTQSIHHTNGMVGSWTDWDLSELGVVQAERIGQNLAKQLSAQKIVMYASNLLRARHTAEIIAAHLGITPIIRGELRERNLGKCVGKSVQWLREIWKFKRRRLMTVCSLMRKAAGMNGIA